MDSGLSSFLRSIGEPSDVEPLPYQRCHDIVHAYIEAELDGKDADALFPEIKGCLEEYTEFKTEYEELKELFVLERSGEFAEPPFEPALDFSFLDQPAAQQLWSMVESAGRRVARLLFEIQVQIVDELASFKQLPPPLTPVTVAGPVTRNGVEDSAGEVQVLTLPVTGGDLSFSLSIGLSPGNRARFNIEISEMDSQRPLPKVRVVLRRHDGQLHASVLTDEAGQASFEDLEVARYLVEIRYHGQIWEIPVDFSQHS